MNKKILCIYHRDCIDGYAAAWVVGLACGFENVDFVSAGYGEAPPDMEGREVYIVDFSYDPASVPRDLLKQMARAKRLVMLDHHESASENWKDVPLLDHWTFRYEPSMSGVGVAWRWFFGGNKPMPAALQLIQDRDLWNFQKPGTREFHAVAVSHGLLDARPMEGSWLGQQVENDWNVDAALPDSIRLEGTAIIRDQKNFLQTLLRRARIVNFMGYEVPVCAIPYEMRSEAGFYLGAKYPFSITYDDKWNEGKRYYSLRSRKKGGLDLVRIGKVSGGGGHAHATGFNRPIDEPFPFDFVNDAQLELELELEPT